MIGAYKRTVSCGLLRNAARVSRKCLELSSNVAMGRTGCVSVFNMYVSLWVWCSLFEVLKTRSSLGVAHSDCDFWGSYYALSRLFSISQRHIWRTWEPQFHTERIRRKPFSSRTVPLKKFGCGRDSESCNTSYTYSDCIFKTESWSGSPYSESFSILSIRILFSTVFSSPLRLQIFLHSSILCQKSISSTFLTTLSISYSFTVHYNSFETIIEWKSEEARRMFTSFI